VKIRLYRGRELNYDANGNIKNENGLVSLEHNTQQWAIFMKNIAISGYCKVEVERVIKSFADGTYEDYDEIPSSFQEEVDKHYQPTKELPVSTESKRIAELEAKLELLLSGKDVKKEEKPKKEKVVVAKKEATEKSEPTIEELAIRDKYIEVFGKNPFNGWSYEVMQEKIDAELAKV